MSAAAVRKNPRQKNHRQEHRYDQSGKVPLLSLLLIAQQGQHAGVYRCQYHKDQGKVLPRQKSQPHDHVTEDNLDGQQ